MTEDLGNTENQASEVVAQDKAPVVLTKRDVEALKFAREQQCLCYDQIRDAG